MISDAYLRKSTADAGRSVARQERDWLADCDRENLTPGRAWCDPDLSASRYARKTRPDYTALLKHISSGHCRMLSLWETSRGSREMGPWVALLDLCREKGTLIRVFGGDPETYDPRRQRDREALMREGMISERESEVIAQRARDGARDLAVRGKPPGPLMYGYTRVYDERGHLVEQVLDSDRADLVRRLAKDTMRGVSLNSQAQSLNRRGILSPKGGQWTGHGIARLLLNPGYAAKRVHNGVVVSDGLWPALLSEDEQCRLRALLRAPGRRHHQDSALAHELSGAAVCGCCGGVLRTLRSTRYVCHRRGCGGVSVRVSDIEPAVDYLIRQRLEDPAAARVFAPPQKREDFDEALAELRRLKDRLSEFVAQAADPDSPISAASLAAVESKLVPQIESVQRRVEVLSTPPVLAEYAGVDVPGRWGSLPVGVRREFIRALVDPLVLGQVGKGGRWSVWRLARSRWRGDDVTWGERWRSDGLVSPAGLAV